MPSMKTFDFYRKLHFQDSTSTLQGIVLSTCAIFFMTVLFLCELAAFMKPEAYSTVMLDVNKDSKIRINFNITMLSLPCEFVSIDVLDVLGTNRVNVSKNIIKWHTDENGNKVEFHGRNKEQDDISMDSHHRDIWLAHEDGEHAIPLQEADWQTYISTHDAVIVDFYAPWCIWCQRLEPTWEAFAEEAVRVGLPVNIVKVDCVSNQALCKEQKIHAFPTIRMFKGGKRVEADYNKDRSLAAFMEYSQGMLLDAPNVGRKFHSSTDNHKGCQLSGFIMVNRVPGNFHIEAKSKHHNLFAAATNVSHTVHTLGFGSTIPMRRRQWTGMENELQGTLNMIQQTFIATELHSAPHHYIKVVSTFLGSDSVINKPGSDQMQYQMIVSNQIMPYDEMDVPEARFTYDLSPMCVVIKWRERKWYTFITNVLAIIGGTFTVIGLVDTVLFRLVKQKFV